MKTKTSLLLLVSCSLLSFAASAAVPNALFAEWQFGKEGTVVSGPLTATLSMKLEKDAVTMIAHCTDGMRSAVAEVRSSATITETQIIIKQSATRTTNVNGLTCNAGIEPGTIQYQLNGNFLMVRDPQGRVATLTRK